MSNNKNAITKLNEAPINTQINTRWEGRGKSTEKRVREREGGGREKGSQNGQQREAEEGTVNLLCISSTGSYEDKLRRYRGHTKKITRDNYAHKSEC